MRARAGECVALAVRGCGARGLCKGLGHIPLLGLRLKLAPRVDTVQLDYCMAEQQENPLSDLSTDLEEGTGVRGVAGSLPEREAETDSELPVSLTLTGLGSRLSPDGEISAVASMVQKLFWAFAILTPVAATHAKGAENNPLSAGRGAVLILFYGPCLCWVAFPFAFDNLCEVTRQPDGQLQKLLANEDGREASLVVVGRSVVKNLAAWRSRIKALVAFFTFFLLLLAAFLMKMATGSDSPLELLGGCVLLVSGVLGLCVSSAWVFSLRLAAAAAMAKTDRVAQRIDALSSTLASSKAFDARQWAAEVEAPARKLALETLPLLSSWGTAVAVVGAGYGGLAAALLLVLIEAKVMTALPIGAVMILYGFALGVGFIPVIIADAPAKVSTACAQMIETLNTIRLRNLALYHEITPIVDTLLSVNHGQGIGFKIGGTVINRRKLWTGVTSIWSIVLTVLPMLSEEDGCPQPDLAPSLHECDYVRGSTFDPAFSAWCCTPSLYSPSDVTIFFLRRAGHTQTASA